MFQQMLKKSIYKSQKCQRNWDLSKDIPKEDVDVILTSATQCPSKQNLPYYKVHAITDRKMIEKIHDLTEGFGPIHADNNYTENYYHLKERINKCRQIMASSGAHYVINTLYELQNVIDDINDIRTPIPKNLN